MVCPRRLAAFCVNALAYGVLVLLAAVPAKSLTFEDGFNESWGEQQGAQFLLPWSAGEIATVRRAMDKLAEEHEKYPDGIDDYLMGRRARILEKLDTYSFIVLGDDGTVFRWVTNPELTLVGFAVSRDRYRVAPMEEPEGQTLVARIMNWFMSTAFAQESRSPPKMVPRLDGLAENVDCYIQNTEAIKLFNKIDAAQHFSPGGASPR